MHQSLTAIGSLSGTSMDGIDVALIAFDTGPSNVLLDDWISRHTGETYDRARRLLNHGLPLTFLKTTDVPEPLTGGVLAHTSLSSSAAC